MAASPHHTPRPPPGTAGRGRGGARGAAEGGSGAGEAGRGGLRRGAAPGQTAARPRAGSGEVTARRAEAAAGAAGRGVWRSLDKELMKRERYIYQGGGDGAEGVGKKDKLFHNNRRKQPF